MLSDDIHEGDASNKNLIETIIEFIENISLKPMPSIILLRERFCTEKSLLAKALFAVVVGSDGKSILYYTLKYRIQNQNIEIKWDLCIEINLVKLLIFESAGQINFNIH